MLLVIDTTNNVVIRGSFDDSTPLKENEILVDPEEKFQYDMLGSIFIDVDNYLPRPTVDGEYVEYVVAQDNEWVDIRSTDQCWEAVRCRRNDELRASDWTQLEDAPVNGAQRSAWQAWRTSLRNIPQTTSTPEEAESALITLLNNKPT